MTVGEAKRFIVELEQKLCNEAIDIFSEENEQIATKFFEVMTFALKNLVPDIKDNNKNKCKTDCMFFTSEHRELCKRLCSQQDCYRCIIKEYEIMKQDYDSMQSRSAEYYSNWQYVKEENIKLKAKLYELMNEKSK